MNMVIVGNIPFLVTEEHCLLIDTGSPISISNKGYIKIEDRYCFLHHRTTADSSNRALGLTGGDRDGVLGMDILKDHSLLLDYDKSEVFIDPGDYGEAAFTADLDMETAAPRITGILRGIEHKFWLDTGSVMSFLLTGLVRGHPQWGWENVCHPIYGPFGTPWFRFRLGISGTEFSLRFGRLPDFLELPLVEGGVSGVIGCEFLSLSRVLLDFKGGKLSFFRGDEEDDMDKDN